MFNPRQDSPPVSRRQFLQCTGAASLALLGAPLLRAAQTPRPLNILLITADDLGMQLGCYGDRTIPTPNLDRLANQGCRFVNGYITQSSCSPSRSSILTGLYPHQNGQIGLANNNYPYAMHAGVRTLPAMLKEAGYRTGIIGKLHVNPSDAVPFDFDRRAAMPTRTVRNVAGQAAEFLAQAPAQPFFLMVNYMDPHVKFFDQVDGLPAQPITAQDVQPWSWQGIDAPAQRQRIAGFYNCVWRLDTGIGLLMEKLTAAGHDDDTLVIFLGDNGPPFARAKTTCYEAGVKVPFLVCWPGAKKAVVREELVSAVDIVPTIAAAAGVPLPADLPGRSLYPLVHDARADWPDTLCVEHTLHGPPGYYPRRAIRDQRYKLIVNLIPQLANPTLAIDGDTAYELSRDPALEGTPARRAFDTLAHPPGEELYDLRDDPDELSNLAGQPAYRDIQDRLRRRLFDWRQRTADPLLDAQKLQALTRQHEQPAKPNP